MPEAMMERDEELMEHPEQEEVVFQPLYPLSESEREDLLKDVVLKRFTASLQYMTTLYPSMIENYKKYRSISDAMEDEDGKEIEGRANIFIPYPWAIVESEMPRLAGRLPRVHVFPKQDVDKEKVSAIQDLIYYTLDRMKFIELETLWLRQHAIYGWSPLFYYWRLEAKKVLERVRGEGGAFPLRKVDKTVWDDFYAKVVDVFDAFPQPGAEDPDEGDWYIFREWWSAADILKRVKAGVFYPEVEKWIKDGHGVSSIALSGEGKAERDSLAGLTNNLTDSHHGKYEVMFTLEDTRTIVTINREIVASVGDNSNPMQEKSLITLRLTQLVNEPMGVGTIESLGGLPDKLNALSNARLDNISLIMNKVVKARRFANIDVKNLRLDPGNVIWMDDLDALEVIDFPDIGASSEREIRTTKEELQFASGIGDYIAGTEIAGRRSDTATGVTTMVREANARFALRLSALESGPMRKLIFAAHAYNMTYMPEKKRIMALGPKGWRVRNVGIEEILCECEFSLEPGSSVPLDQLSRREYLISVLDRAIQAQNVVDLNQYFREVFEAGEIRNVDSLMVAKEREIPEFNDVRLAEAENLSLSQEQEVELKGNDVLHLSIHSHPMEDGEWNEWSPEARALLQAHLLEHQQRMQMMQMAALAASQNNIFGVMGAGGIDGNAGAVPNGAPGGGSPSGVGQGGFLGAPQGAPGGLGGFIGQ